MTTRWRRNHKCEQPSLLAFVDTETYHLEAHDSYQCGKHVLKLGCASFCRWNGSDISSLEDMTFRTADEFWDRLRQHGHGKSVCWLFAHNLMFDLWVLGWPELVQIGKSLLSISPIDTDDAEREGVKSRREWRGLCSIEHGATIIHTITHGKRVNLCDTLNYFRSSLAELGQSIGVEKLRVDYKTVNDDDLITYCRRDVDIIKVAVTSLLREWRANDLGNWQPTIASLAFSSYRHRFAPFTVVAHNDQSVGDQERLAYYDGRTMPFRVGKVDEPVYHVDVNSLYPSVMLGNDYPLQAECDDDGRPIVLTDVDNDELHSLLTTHCVVANVALQTQFPWYPYRFDSRVIYPTGTFTTALCTPELILALSRGHVVKCHWLVFYRKAELFTQWVSYWHARRNYHRDNANFAAAEVCKAAMNSLFGKFSQKGIHWVNNPRIEVPEPWSSWTNYDANERKAVKCRSVGWTSQVQIDVGDSRYSLVAVSAHVASYARIRMLSMMRACHPGCVLYIGNDSLIVDGLAYDELCRQGLVDQRELGRLKLISAYDDITIHGARDYETAGRTVKAGLPGDATKIGPRLWRANLIECPDSLIGRPPDGTVHTQSATIQGGFYDRFAQTDATGWVKTPHIGRDNSVTFNLHSQYWPVE